MIKLKFVLAVFLFIVVSSCTPSAKYLAKIKNKKGASSQDVRILLGVTSSSFLIGSKGRFKILNLENRKVVSDVKNTMMKIFPATIKKKLIIEAWNKPLIYNGRKYRGNLELHNVFGKIYIVNVLDLESYLLGVVPNEIPAGWNIEALKAQAVAARTYTVYHLTRVKRKMRIYDLDSTTNFQVYKGLSSEKRSTTKAVHSTKSQIMTYENEPILAYFHSTCGGKTISDKYVWKGNDLPYLKAVKCDYCKKSKYYKWNETITLDQLNKTIKPRFKGMGRITSVSFKRIEGRVVDVKIVHSRGNLLVPANKFRLMFSAKKLKSLYIETKGTKNGILINGRGWGHGVGMCQWGAKGMAEKKYNYRSILKHYYKNISIETIR